MFKYKDTKNNECYVCAVKYNFLPNKFRFSGHANSIVSNCMLFSLLKKISFVMISENFL